MRDNITGKSILLIADPFYGYWMAIRDTLMTLGAKSVYFKQAPFYQGSLRDKISVKSFIAFLLNPRVRSKWTKSFIKELEGMKFDTLFVVENMPFTKDFPDYLRSVNPNIRCILFLWDTLKTQQSRYVDFLPKFDTVYTFDRDDSKKFNLNYFPDFYIEETPKSGVECQYDMAFIGSMNHGETKTRAKILHYIHEFCSENNLHSFLYLKYYPYSGNLIRKICQIIKDIAYYKIVRKYKNDGFLFSKPLPLSVYNEIMANAKIVVDLNYHDRQGMTINVITALAKGKKLVTTNKRIKEESFYNPDMIYILDDRIPHLDMNFIRTNYSTVDFSYLRMDNWLKHVVNETI